MAMGKPLMIQEDDERRIEALKRQLGIQTKVDVVRAGIDLLEREAQRRQRVERWKRAAALAARTSRSVNADFRKHSRMKSDSRVGQLSSEKTSGDYRTL